jgi:hypothetical protein
MRPLEAALERVARSAQDSLEPGVEHRFRRACQALQRAALLAWDSVALRRWADIQQRWASVRQSRGDALSATAADAWADLLEARTVRQSADGLRAEAAKERQAALVIEISALEAMQALHAGDVTRALVVARRASRMAQTETLPWPLSIASLVLARVRRYSGHPDLALRIVAVLAPRSPQRGQPWLAWESLLAGGIADGGGVAAGAVGSVTDVPSHAAAAVAALTAVLRTPSPVDDHAERAAGVAALERTLGPCPAFRDEAMHLLALLDPDRPPTPQVQAWQQGQVADPPAGLQALLAAQAPGVADGAVAVVLAIPGARGRRVLWAAAHAPMLPGAPDEAQPRVATGLAALALVGPAGLSIGEFFRAAYSLDFVRSLHRGSLDVLVHRMRKAIAAHGDIERDDERIVLRLAAAIAIPDPRCRTPIDARLSRLLSRTGPLSTEAAAAELGLPVRTARVLLRQFVADGLCRELREGRFVRYQIEDTTFSEPTPAL